MKPGLVKVTFEYSRAMGPRSMHGGLTLEFSKAASYSFSSTAQWPSSDDYTNAVEASVREVLDSKGVANQTACKLTGVTWHPVNSCQSGFQHAARAATLAAMEV